MPARYGQILEADIKRSVDQINLDIHRRVMGHPPIHPDSFLDEKRPGHVFIVIGDANVSLAESVVKAVEQLRPPKKRPA